MDKKVAEYIVENRSGILHDFQVFLKQPSVSAQSRGIRECSQLLEKFMAEAGIETEVVNLPVGNPVLLGKVTSGKSKRTLLFYGHYDVQPPEPLEEWKTDPFNPELKDGKVIARGASDSKNNVMALVKTVQAYRESVGDVPVSLKFLFEGEEEIASPHLPQFVEENKSRLGADAVICYDGDIHESGRANIHLGLKGILYVELHCKGPKVDLHSSLAPLSPNPAWRLIWALNTIKGAEEKIKIDGWYDRLHVPTKDEIELLKKIPFDEQREKSEMGLTSFLRERRGLEALQAALFEPTCNVCGFLSGYTAEGSKTVLPSKAMVKLDFRLVYDQNPEELLGKLKPHLRNHGFDDIEVVKLGTLEPSKTPVTAPIAQSAISAGTEVFGKEPIVFPNAAGSGPDYLFTKRLGLNSVWAGCASAFSKAHAPNEFELVDDLFKGIEYAGTIMEKFAQT
jgi:acetylornithine deacetylase/succinyl-diaminopimelate desuccinylase-like protein